MKLTVIVKPTHSCNLGCEYCYVRGDAEQGVMDEGTLENTIRKTLDVCDGAHFIWHGGEPLLMPLDFYRKAAEMQDRNPEKKVKNSVQSNGTLVTDSILDFCRERQFNIGFSLDGPRNINDRTRHFKDGRSSFEKTLESIHKAKLARVGGGAIVVVSRANIDDLLDIYTFAREQRINVKFSPLISAGNASGKYQELGVGPQEYGRALIEVFDAWFYDDDANIRLATLEEIMGNLITGKPHGCCYLPSCQHSFISIGPRGDIYPCGRFDGLGEFWLGNINSDDLSKVLNADRRAGLQERGSKVDGCSPCRYRRVCNSGCMHTAQVMSGNMMDRDYYCNAYKMIFSHISKAIAKELPDMEVV